MPTISSNSLCFFLLRFTISLLGLLALLGSTPACYSQENPYIVAYDHNLEEPGSLEVEYFSTLGTQRGGPDFHAYWAELEYGATAWWTTELYLDAQTTFGDSTVFTGYRWENRVRPLKNEHLINPVLYVEFEDINGADKIMKEVEGHDVESDYAVPNALARQERTREMEFKLVLSSNHKGWNLTENTIATKNLSNEPWEFGYAMGISRPLVMKGAAHRCNLCRQHFVVGAELYGGLGDRYNFGLRDTSHYLGAGLAWNLPSGWTFRIEPTVGLSDNSHQFLLRCGVSREFSGFGSMVSGLFRERQE